MKVLSWVSLLIAGWVISNTFIECINMGYIGLSLGDFLELFGKEYAIVAVCVVLAIIIDNNIAGKT